MRAAHILVAVALVCAVARGANAEDEKSPGVALALPLGGVVVGTLALSALAGDSEAEPHQIVPAALLMLAGPSLGHMYTGDWDLAIGGTLLRVVGFAMIAEGSGTCEAVDDPYAGTDECEYVDQKPGLLAAGAVVVLGTAIAEIVDSPFAARRYNREAMSITPAKTGSGYGVALTGTF